MPVADELARIEAAQGWPRTAYLAQVRNPNPAIAQPVRRDWPRTYAQETEQQ